MKPAIDLHKIGEKIEFNDARERTNSSRSEAILTLGAGRKGPGTHIHTLQEEGFKVLSGQMIAIINRKEIVVNAGETIVVKPGEAHTFRNGKADEPMVAKFWYEPALNTEWMLQTMGADAMKNGGDWAKVSLLPTFYIMYKMRQEYRLAGMPTWFQDLLFGLLAGIAKLTGAAKKVPLPESMSKSRQTVRQGQAVTVN